MRIQMHCARRWWTGSAVPGAGGNLFRYARLRQERLRSRFSRLRKIKPVFFRFAVSCKGQRGKLMKLVTRNKRPHFLRKVC